VPRRPVSGRDGGRSGDSHLRRPRGAHTVRASPGPDIQGRCHAAGIYPSREGRVLEVCRIQRGPGRPRRTMPPRQERISPTSPVVLDRLRRPQAASNRQPGSPVPGKSRQGNGICRGFRRAEEGTRTPDLPLTGTQVMTRAPETSARISAEPAPSPEVNGPRPDAEILIGATRIKSPRRRSGDD
jgi:hypothetical protein